MEQTSTQNLVGLLDTSFPLLALSLIPIENVEGGIFSRITMTSMTSKWYLRLSHFEAILVGLIVLQVFVMRYFLILPLDVTKLIEDGTLLATSVSRKKRNIFTRKRVQQQQRLAESMFSILRRLDEYDCFVRTLCELEFNSKIGHKKSDRLSPLLASLKRMGLQRIRLEAKESNNITVLERKVIAEFEDAVLLGSGYSTETDTDSHDTCQLPSETVCASHFSLCPADKNELLEYVGKIIPFLS